MTPSTTALITGATHGIGRATAFALGRAGYRVGVCSRTGSKIAALVEELRGAGIEAAGRAGDVPSPATSPRSWSRCRPPWATSGCW